MKIALDMSPLKSGHYLQHRVRGTGFYLRNLKESLQKYYPNNDYIYFDREEQLVNGVDVVHYPYFEPFFLTLPVFSKNKRVVTVHDLTPLVFPSHFNSGFRGAIKWQIQKLALMNTDSIITDSESSRKDIIKYANIEPTKVKVVYLAAGSEFRVIESKDKKENIIKKYNLPKKFALYVGDATWNKNLPKLIEAALKNNIPLVLAGKALVDKCVDTKNPWNKDLVKVQKMAETNKNIFRLGFVGSEDLVSLYNAATLFVMPSIYEGFGLPILEAMSCGCPVVASRGGSLAEVVSDAGKIVDPYNVDDIAKGIKDVFEDSILRKALIGAGLKQSKKFSWDKTAKETISVYESVLCLAS